MARTQELSKLFQAIATADVGGARTVARSIIAEEARMGHRSTASVLAGALHGTGIAELDWEVANRSEVIVPDSLLRLPDTVHLAQVELTAVAAQGVAEVLREFALRERLASHGLPRRSALLFHGPPGSGKTLTAQAIGTELGLPVYIARFDSLFGSLLGQTAGRIRDIFGFAQSQPCVLLLDEIDVLGRRRGQASDVRELDRVVVALMQQLDLAHPAGLVIATTNMAQELDPALLRRFSLSIEFPPPSTAALDTFAQKKAKLYKLRLTKALRNQVLASASFAEAEALIIQARRAEVLGKGK